MRTLNLGILAHVDAGKTTLTERLLYTAGAIDHIGGVDEGTTQTDYLELERERGITIRAAVATFELDDLVVNIVDTPGHPDFIAEVERSLSVLDGAVLVISAVEGVQSQTPLLMRALQRLRIPTLIFINKIDRPGADDERVLAEISRRLTTAIVPMGSARRLGTPSAAFVASTDDDNDFRRLLAEVLAEGSEDLLREFVESGTEPEYGRLRSQLAEQSKRGFVHPVFFGSARTGAGVDALTDGLRELLPPASGVPDGALAGRVFKIERSNAGQKVAYVRMFSGVLRVRERIRYGSGLAGKVTRISVFAPGGTDARQAVQAGEIGQVWGLDAARVGDLVGETRNLSDEHHFPPPTLEAVVVAARTQDSGALRQALNELAEQDPLINVRQDETYGDISVSLYGDVQKEVLDATLAREYGIQVVFHETATICVERPVATGQAGEVLRAKTHTNVTGASSPHSTNPFQATLGLRVEPAAIGAGVEVRLDVDVRLVPLYIYKTVDAFVGQMTRYVGEALSEGLYGWQVTDCAVTVIDCGYRAPGTTAGDFHKLARLVMMRALEDAGTVVCQPMTGIRLEFLTGSLSSVLTVLGRLGSRGQPPVLSGELAAVEAIVPVARLQELRRLLPGLTGGEGVLETRFAGYEPVVGDAPRRRGSPADPSAARSG